MRILMINLLILLFGIACLELIFGGWWINNNLFLTRIPRDVQIKFPVNKLYNGFTTVNYTRDRFGLRGDYEDLGSIDILTVGGSTTDQRYIDDDETWQKHLQVFLINNTGKSYSVINAGIDGQTSYGHIGNFTDWWSFIPKLKPRYILFYVGLNDAYEAVSGPNGSFDSAVRPIKDIDKIEWREIFRAKSAFYNAWINAAGLKIVKREGITHRATDWGAVTWVPVPDVETMNAQEDLLLENYRKRIVRLVELTASIGAKAIIVNQKSLLSKPTENGTSVFVWGDGYSYENQLKSSLQEKNMQSLLTRPAIRPRRFALICILIWKGC